jgi:AraC family transcriptional regulator
LQAIDWAREAATMTFYLALGLLVDAAHEALGVTGELVWVGREGHTTSLLPVVRPALLVQVATTPRPVECIELVPHLPAHDPLLRHTVLVLQAASTATDVVGRVYAEALATALALHLLRRYAACRPPGREVGGLAPYKLRRVMAYIQAHLEHALPLAELAAVAQTSPAHFARLFKQTTGQTSHQYVITCRIERAKQLLTETALPLSEIGPQVGCTDQSHFTALFRTHAGLTPKAYRDATTRA